MVSNLHALRTVMNKKVQGGQGGAGPGSGSDKIQILLAFQFIMERFAKKLNLPNLRKEGEGKIHVLLL